MKKHRLAAVLECLERVTGIRVFASRSRMASQLRCSAREARPLASRPQRGSIPVTLKEKTPPGGGVGMFGAGDGNRTRVVSLEG